MGQKSMSYEERAMDLARAIDMACPLMDHFLHLAPNERKILIDSFLEIRHMALNPLPPFKKLPSLKYLEEAFFTFWNEENGTVVEEFWHNLNEIQSCFKRKDVFDLVKKRGKIKDIHEYEFLADWVVLAEQDGRINHEMANHLKRMLGDFEQRKRRS